MKNLANKNVEMISNGVLLVGIGILFYTGYWWPGILLAVWAAMATRHLLTARWAALIVTSVIWIGLYLTFYLKFDWQFVMPAVFILGGILIIAREFFGGNGRKQDPDAHS